MTPLTRGRKSASPRLLRGPRPPVVVEGAVVVVGLEVVVAGLVVVVADWWLPGEWGRHLDVVGERRCGQVGLAGRGQDGDGDGIEVPRGHGQPRQGDGRRRVRRDAISPHRGGGRGPLPLGATRADTCTPTAGPRCPRSATLDHHPELRLVGGTTAPGSGGAGTRGTVEGSKATVEGSSTTRTWAARVGEEPSWATRAATGPGAQAWASPTHTEGGRRALPAARRKARRTPA